ILDLPQNPSLAPQIENPKSKIQNPKSKVGARPESTTFLERRGFFPNSSYVQMRLDHIGSQPEPRVLEGFHFRPIADTGKDPERWAELIRLTFGEPATGPGIAAQLAEPGNSPAGYIFAVEDATGLEV